MTKKNLLFEIIEWTGMLLLVGAYAGNTFLFFVAESVEYLLLNLIGGLFVGLSVFRKKAYGAATLEFIWMGIAVIGFLKYFNII